MTTMFLNAIPYILEHEGHLNDRKGDMGGATNWGVSIRYLKLAKIDINHDGVIDDKDIRDMTMDEAKEIYFNEFWKPYYENLPDKLSIKLFDFGVNAGTFHSNEVLQKTLNTLGSKVVVDGLVGVSTISEVKKYPLLKLLSIYCEKQKEYYNDLVENHPDQAVNLKGWINRANWLPK